jgi:hypothetical protein
MKHIPENKKIMIIAENSDHIMILDEEYKLLSKVTLTLALTLALALALALTLALTLTQPYYMKNRNTYQR